MPIANLKDVSLYYEEAGQGEPVLLVPPSWWPAATWNVGVVPVLSQRYRTIIFDCRGTGRSSKPRDGYTVQQFAQDGIALLSDLKICRCHVVGFACSLYGCLSSRCKSGHGNWLFARVVILDTPQG
jgi:3-oxoadipate enol-lactonase